MSYAQVDGVAVEERRTGMLVIGVRNGMAMGRGIFLAILALRPCPRLATMLLRNTRPAQRCRTGLDNGVLQAPDALIGLNDGRTRLTGALEKPTGLPRDSPGN